MSRWCLRSMQWIPGFSNRHVEIVPFVPAFFARKPVLRKSMSGVLSFAIVTLLLTRSFSLAAETPQDLLAAGRVDQAIQTLQHQIQTSPSADAFNLLCRAQLEIGAWDAGIPSCEKAVALAPDNGRYHLWLGRIYGGKAERAGMLSATGLAKKVHHEFERAVELSPDSWEARTDLAEFYVEAPGIVGGGKDKARAQAERIAPLNPAMAHWVKGRIAEKNKDLDLAENEYLAAVEASHGGSRAWLNLAGFYRHVNRTGAMENALRKLESSPLDHPGALVDGASILVRTGRDPDLATRLLHRYLESGATVEEAPVFWAYYLLGQLFEKQGDRTGAAEQYRAALALAHSYRLAQEGLKRVS
jgi:tetratricopeptide (TPR) repeat protein